MPPEPLIFVYGTLYIVFKLIFARECLVCVQSFYVQAFLIMLAWSTAIAIHILAQVEIN